MSAYNFKPQFEPAIMADLKRHTIRAKRKDGRRPKVGEVLSLYVGMRTKACRLLKRRRCVKVQEIVIAGQNAYFVTIDGTDLDMEELEAFARSDGFPSFRHFSQYWKHI